MVIPRLGVQLELQLLASTTATATSDLSRICDLHHSSWQCQILNSLSEARDPTRNLMVPSQISFCCAMTGTPHIYFLMFVDILELVFTILLFAFYLFHFFCAFSPCLKKLSYSIFPHY